MADRNIKIKIQIVGLKEIDTELRAVTGTTTKLNTVQNKLEANIKAHNKLISDQTKAEATLNTTNKERYRNLIETKVQTQANAKAIKDKAKADLEATTAVINAEAALSKQIVTVRDAEKANAAYRLGVKNSNTTTDEGRAAIAKYNEEIDKNDEFINNNSDTRKKNTQNVGGYTESIKKAYYELQKESEELRKTEEFQSKLLKSENLSVEEQNKLQLEYKETTDKLAKVSTELVKYDGVQDDSTKKSKDGSEAVSLYGDALGGMGGKFGGSLKVIKSGFTSIRGASKVAFSSIKAGLISTGLIVFSIAVAALFGYFKKVESAAKSLEGVFAGLGAIIDTVVEAGLKLSKAFGFLLKGDLKGAANEASEAMDGLSGDSLKSAYNDGKRLVDMAWELEQANTAAVLSNAENRNIVAEQLLLSKDLKKSVEERREATIKSGEAERAILATNTAMKQKALDIAILELESTPELQRTEEQRLAISQARADLLDAETTSLTKRKKIQNNLNTLDKEAASLKAKEAKAIADIAKAKEKEFNDFSASILKEQALQQKANDDKLKVQEDWLKASDALDAEFEADIEAEEEAADLKLETTLERMQADREAIAAFDLELAGSEEEQKNKTYKSNMVKLEARRKEELDAAKKAGVYVKEAQALINKKYNKAEIAENKAHNKAIEDLQDEANKAKYNSYKDAASALSSFLGDSKAAKLASLAIDKGFATADIWMNTAVANAEALTYGPLLAPGIITANNISAFIGTASVVASAAKGVSEINSASKFALGGFIGGASHSNGGTIVEGENGEYIVNKRTMSDPNMAASIIGMNNAGNAGGSQSGLSASDIAQIVIDSIKSIPVVVTESAITDLQKEVLLRESNL